MSVNVSTATRAPVIGAPRVRASQAFKRLWANPSGRIGLLMLTAMVIAAAAAPLLAPYSPNTQDYTHIMQAPNSHSLLGTDDLGRDILSRVLYGGRISLRVGALPVGFVIGTCIGVVAGFYRGIVDDLIMRLTDIALAFPGVLLALVVIAILGPGLTNVMIALGIADIPIAVRVSRGEGRRISTSALACSRIQRRSAPARPVRGSSAAGMITRSNCSCSKRRSRACR